MLECLVAEALLFADSIDQAIIEVEELDGIITLKGMVGSLQDSLTAEGIARKHEGVVDVINELWVMRSLRDEYVEPGEKHPEATI